MRAALTLPLVTALLTALLATPPASAKEREGKTRDPHLALRLTGDIAHGFAGFQGDTQGEQDEPFTIQLVNPSGTTILPGQDMVTGTINNDD